MKKTPKVKRLTIALYIAVAFNMILLAILIMVLTGNVVQPKRPDNASNTAITPVPTIMTASDESGYILVENPYIMLRLPKENSEYIMHEQEVHGITTTETFYMVDGEKKKPLYRIDFGDKTSGDWLGTLKTENSEIPITYTVFALSEEEIGALGESEEERYFALLDGFSIMLDGIYSDSRFSAEKPLDIGADQQATLAHWTLTLPGNMTWTESTENGSYHAVFYGMVQGERIALYTVRIGDETAQTVLGQYKLDGVDKPISVESYDLAENANWTEDDYSAAYRMMDTINELIQAITSSENFSIPQPAEQ
ncbi:MAG: hypothetical protein J6K55_10150 [Clostridia bacterium]|nr:hypothetical protein [Clostridia bacterium]